MMKEYFDYYYLVLLRWYDGTNKKTKDRFSFRIPGMISGLFGFNFISLAILLNKDFFIELHLVFWVVFVVGVLIFSEILDRKYNKKRRQELRAKYWRESRESRRRGQCRVILYVIFSFALFIFACSTLVP